MLRGEEARCSGRCENSVTVQREAAAPICVTRRTENTTWVLQKNGPIAPRCAKVAPALDLEAQANKVHCVHSHGAHMKCR